MSARLVQIASGAWVHPQSVTAIDARALSRPHVDGYGRSWPATVQVETRHQVLRVGAETFDAAEAIRDQLAREFNAFAASHAMPTIARRPEATRSITQTLAEAAPAVTAAVTPPPPKSPAPAPAATPSSSLLRLSPGDPRWAAWIAYHIAGGSPDAEDARAAQRGKWDYEVPDDWPPPSAEVSVTSIGTTAQSVTIPWGTPEHAAWLAFLRREDRAAKAQSLDVARSQITRSERWPPIKRNTVARLATQKSRGAPVG